jgi:hypothetical protein
LKAKILFLTAILAFSFTASAGENLGFIEPKPDMDEEMKEAIGEMRNDFAHTVPEPMIAKSDFIRMNSPTPKSKAGKKVAKHAKAKHSRLAKHAKSKKKTQHIARSGKGRSIASVSKPRKAKTLAKRGHGSKTLR